MRVGLILLLIAWSVTARASDLIEFSGMCDASAAIRLRQGEFVVANDEDNVLRVYSVAGGPPRYQLELSGFLGTRKESDIEGAAAIGERIYWITSHGRKKDGKATRARQKLFTIDPEGSGESLELEPIASAPISLLPALAGIKDLEKAIGLAGKTIELAPKKKGINIEGLARGITGDSLLIGFRNPRPDGRALIVPLDNPARVVAGEEPVLGAPIRLDLGGRGIRSLHYLAKRSTYLIVAGPRDESPPGFQLYSWSGPETSNAQPLAAHVPSDLTPEAVISNEEGTRVLLISDDGSRRIASSKAQCDKDFEAFGNGGTCPCKRLNDPSLQEFRARWISLP